MKAGREQCDDGNTARGDGCSNCIVEEGWGCQTRSGVPSRCGTICGDGLVLGTEKCDDGNSIENDGCFNCVIE